MSWFDFRALYCNIRAKETVAALLEAERIAKDSSVKGFHNVDDLFEDLDS